MTERSKTKQKILTTALGLFNNEGESQVSSVDIASVMGISPGNLYYHYKGKDEIISALFDDFEAELRMVLAAPISKPLSLPDNWVYLYIIFEEIFDFRFFYKNVSELIGRNPDLRARFGRLLSLKEKTALSLLTTLEASGNLDFEEGEAPALAQRLAQHFTFWLQYHDLRYNLASPKSLIDQGVFTALVQITPYIMRDEQFSDRLAEFLQGQNQNDY